MPDNAEQQIEESVESKSGKVSDTVTKESDSGRSELLDQQKDYAKFLKLGGTSGITDEFGKPLYMIGEKDSGKQDVDKSSLDALQARLSETVKGLPPESVTNARTETSIGAPADHGQDAGGNPGDKGAGTLAKPSEAATQKGSAKETTAYRGEDIHRDIEPGYHTAQKGETLVGIAKGHLGPDASPEEIKKYATEIAVRNGMNPQKPSDLEGKELALPGNTKDGGYIYRDDYSTRTTWPDGSEKVERWDGRGREHHPTPDGGYVEKHWGPRPEDNYGLQKTADGKFLIADKPGDKPVEVPPGSEDVRVERTKLEQLAESKIQDPEKLAKFRADMLRFEERGAKQDPPLSPAEIAETYKQEQRLMNATGASPLKEGDRVKLAEQVMSQAATPTSIDQGQHNSCSVTTVETRTYTRNPSEAARLVTDVATTGQYKTADGTMVNVDPSSIAARDQEARNNPPTDGDRSHASQIFQVTAVNSYYEKHGYDYKDANGVDHHVPPGKLKYVQNDVPLGTNPPETGERLVDTSTTPATTIMEDWKNNTPLRSPDLTDGGIAEVSKNISGKDDTVYLGHEKAVQGDKKGVTTFADEGELKDEIARAKAEHKMPVIIRVHTGEEPFLHDSGGGKAGGSGGWHVVTITDYDEKTGCVKIDNQWGSSVDHPGDKDTVSVHDLFRASRSPDYKETTFGITTGGTEHDLKKDVEWDRKNNTVDTRKELELLRLEHKNGELSDKEYTDQMKKCIDDANERWAKQKADGTFNASEHDNAVAKIKDMNKILPAEQRLDVLQKEYQRNVMTSEQYDDAVVQSFREFGARKPSPSDDQKREFAKKYTEMINNLPEDRRQQIMTRCGN